MTGDGPLPEITREDSPADFAIRLRMQAFPSQRAAARYFGCSASTINRYEKEGITPALGYLADLMTQLLDRRAQAGTPSTKLEADRQFLLEQLRKLIKWFPEEYKYRDSPRTWQELVAAAERYHTNHAAGESGTNLTTGAPTEGSGPMGSGPEVGYTGGRDVAPFRIPYPRNPLFVGREDVLAQLDMALGSGAVAALSGMAGVGKTQVVIEYAYCAREHYPGGIFWLNMEHPAGIANQVAACAGPDGIEVPNWDAGHFAFNLAAVRAAWMAPIARLLIFDNVEDPGVLADWRPRVGGSRVLVTTRRAGWPAGSGVKVVALTPLPRADSQELLLLPRARQQERKVADLLADPVTGARAAEICDLLGDLPLALALAGAYLETYETLPLMRYRSQLVQETLSHPSLNTTPDDELPTGHLPSVEATFTLSYKQLDGTRAEDQAALQLLHRLAYCAPTPIPQRLFARLADVEPGDPDAPEQVTPVRRRLTALGLIDPLPDGDAQLHRLLAVAVRQRAEDPSRDAAAVAAALLAEVAAVKDAGALPAAQPYLPHLRFLLDQQHTLPDRVVGHLQLQLGELLYRSGDLTGGRMCYEQALAVYRQAGGEADPDALTSRIRLARVARHQGDFAYARPLLETAVALCEQALGPAHVLTATSLNQLAGLLREAGEVATAQPLAERGLAIRESIHGRMHPDIADSLTNLGHILLAQNDIVGAQSLFERSLQIRMQLLGAVHPDTATSWHNLGLVAHAQGNLLVAQGLYERAQAIYEQTLGPTHPDAARAITNLARLWRDRGDAPCARVLYQRALTMYEQSLGPQHPTTEKVRAAFRQVSLLTNSNVSG